MKEEKEVRSSFNKIMLLAREAYMMANGSIRSNEGTLRVALGDKIEE